MKKKITAIVLTSAMVISLLSGCGKKDEPAHDNETVTEENQTDTQDAAEVEESSENIEEVVARTTHYDVLPEVANATIADGEIYQIGDIVLYEDYRMSVDDVKAAVANSQTGAYVEEYEEDGLIGLRLYDPNGLDYHATYLEWKYVDPSQDRALPVPEAGVYLSDVYICDYAEEDWGITDSVYFTGGYCLSDPILGDVKSNSKTHDEIIAEFEALGCEKVNDLPSSKSMTAGEKGYYTDKDTLIQYIVNDNYWTGKTYSDGSTVVFPVLGEFYFDENGVCTRDGR